MKATHGICDDAVIATCHTVHEFMLWQQYFVTWYMCSCCDSNMSHGTHVHAVTATCHMVHVFMLWQQHVIRYTCLCCDSNMLSHGTRVHAVTATCHMVHVFMLWHVHMPPSINTWRTGDADLRLYITTVQDGWRKSEFFNMPLVSTHITLNYAIHGACLRMVLLTDVYRSVTSLRINDL